MIEKEIKVDIGESSERVLVRKTTSEIKVEGKSEGECSGKSRGMSVTSLVFVVLVLLFFVYSFMFMGGGVWDFIVKAANRYESDARESLGGTVTIKVCDANRAGTVRTMYFFWKGGDEEGAILDNPTDVDFLKGEEYEYLVGFSRSDVELFEIGISFQDEEKRGLVLDWSKVLKKVQRSILELEPPDLTNFNYDPVCIKEWHVDYGARTIMRVRYCTHKPESFDDTSKECKTDEAASADKQGLWLSRRDYDPAKPGEPGYYHGTKVAFPSDSEYWKKDAEPLEIHCALEYPQNDPKSTYKTIECYSGGITTGEVGFY